MTIHCPTCGTAHTLHPETGPFCSPLCLSQSTGTAARAAADATQTPARPARPARRRTKDHA